MRYEVGFRVTVDLEVADDNDVITRCGNKHWRRQFVAFSELMEGPVEMLARCCGLFGLPVSHLDGWGDCPDTAVRAAITKVELERVTV